MNYRVTELHSSMSLTAHSAAHCSALSPHTTRNPSLLVIYSLHFISATRSSDTTCKNPCFIFQLTNLPYLPMETKGLKVLGLLGWPDNNDFYLSHLAGGTLCHWYVLIFVYDIILFESNHVFCMITSAALRACFLFVAGIVRTSVIVTGVQVFSRIFMVWFIANSIRQVSHSTATVVFHSAVHWNETIGLFFLLSGSVSSHHMYSKHINHIFLCSLRQM